MHLTTCINENEKKIYNLPVEVWLTVPNIITECLHDVLKCVTGQANTVH